MTNSTRKSGIQQAEDMQDEHPMTLALPHAEDALNVLVGVMLQEDADPVARVAAASAILDLGWGKPGVAVEVSGEAVLASDNTPGEDEEPTRH